MPSAISKLQDKQWLVSQYVEKMRSAEDIAKEVGCNKSAVCRALDRHGVERRKRTSKYALLSDEKWLRTKYEEEGYSLNEIAEMTGSTAGNVHAHLVSKGIETRSGSEALSIKYPDGRTGEKAANWKGGRRVANQSGYIQIHKPDHPYATQAGYVMEHRLVMEEQLGRYLEPDEDVHHVNEDTTDNRPENLVVLNRLEHKLVHSLLRRAKKKEALNRRTKEQEQRIVELESEMKRLKDELKQLRE